jgi:hypothetical protein
MPDNTEPQNATVKGRSPRKKVDIVVFNRLKQSYDDKFHGSPTKLRAKLNETFSEEIDKTLGASGHLISEKTIRNFFSSVRLPSPSTKTLNYFCKAILGYESYGEAFRTLIAEQQLHTDSDSLDCITKEVHGDIDLSGNWLESYRQKVRELWSTVKVLDMSEALPLEEIYSDTYFLDSIKGRRQLDYEEALSEWIGSSSVDQQSEVNQEKRVSGLEKIKECPKLSILGHGGFGKTLFLKHLVLKYLDAKVAFQDFREKLVPVYIPLKLWADEIVTTDLSTVIIDIFKGVIPDSETIIDRMLNDGQFLILLDAIDESGKNIKEICKAISKFTRKFHKNRVVITCRIETTECQFDGFTEVEIASFTEEQVNQFATKWFAVRGLPKLGLRFLEHIKDNAAILSLTKNPLSLTYLCLVFRDNQGFPRNRSGIYKNVVDIFLYKWDASREIDDRIPVESLSAQRKSQLFREIAYQGMTKQPPQFLWKELDLEHKIHQFIERVSTIKPEEIYENTIKLVLQVLIRDHGLMVPQSRSFYAFPYRTFQEYFTAKEVIALMTKSELILKEIVSKYLADKEWENIFMMITELIPDADNLFKLIFAHVNALIAESEVLQNMLSWLHSTTKSFEVDSSSWRAICLAIDLDTDLYISCEIDIDKRSAQELSVGMKKFNKERNKVVPNHPKLIVALYLITAHSYASDKAMDTDPRLNNSSDYITSILVIKKGTSAKREIEFAVNKATASCLDSDLIDDLKSLQTSMPLDSDAPQKWQEWAKSLRQVMIYRLNIGHQVNFSKEENDALSDYLYANNLLVKCLSGDSLSTRSLREKIFDHLLLPMDSIPVNLR